MLLKPSDFNKLNSIGDTVIYIEDNGFTRTRTKLRSKAWALGDGTPVVKIEGKTGGVSLTRIRNI